MQDTEFYPIRKEGQDFIALPDDENRGTRAKKIVDIDGKKAIFKYDHRSKKFRGSEDCSEKIASELATVLGYKTAKIDLAEGLNGERGVLSYLFVDVERDEEHTDAEAFLGIEDRSEETSKYTLENIRNILSRKYPTVPFTDFLKIIFFDVLVGERDRHGGNWGITRIGDRYSISPLYDTATCLLRDLHDEKYIAKFENGAKDFGKYLSANCLAICKEDGTGNYCPPESAIDYLLDKYPESAIGEIQNLEKLTDDVVSSIINKIPRCRMADKQKEYIIKYIITQRNNIIQKGVKK